MTTITFYEALFDAKHLYFIHKSTAIKVRVKVTHKWSSMCFYTKFI